MRTLVRKSVWSCLSQPIPGSTHTKHEATLGQDLAERVKRMEGAVRQAHDGLCSNPLQWDPLLWAHAPVPLNPFWVSHGAFSTSVPMPPRTRPTYQQPPPLPSHTLKKPSKSGPTKSQPAIRRTSRNSKRPSSHASAPPRPTHPQLFHVLLNTHARSCHKNAYGCHSTIRPPSLGRLPNAQKPPALSHPHAPEHATVKHAYSSPLDLPLLGATHHLALPVTARLGTSQIFFVHPVTFCPLHLTPSTLGPFPSPPPPWRVTQHSSNHTIRANTPCPWRAAFVMYYMLHVVYILSEGLSFRGSQPQNKVMPLRTLKKHLSWVVCGIPCGYG